LTVRRVVVVAIIACLSLEMSGLAAVCGDPVGATDCDRSGGDCPPNCDSCVCCSFPKTTAPALPAGTPVLEVVTRGWTDPVDAPLSVEPADIFHVPKQLLA
jgi:hypothetical protein